MTAWYASIATVLLRINQINFSQFIFLCRELLCFAIDASLTFIFLPFIFYPYSWKVERDMKLERHH